MFPLSRFRIVFFLLLGMGGLSPLFASISVAPAQLFIDSKKKIGEVFLTNTSPNMVDVAIDFKFGFPESDDFGNITIPLHERTYEHPNTIAPFLYVYPRRLTLYPGQTRTVRIVVRAPEGLADGEYWARAVFSSEVRNDGRTENGDPGKASSYVTFKYAIIVPVYYRTGKVSADLAMPKLETSIARDSLFLTSYLQRTGNGAYLGIRKVQIFDAKGEIVHDLIHDFAVYEQTKAVDRVPLATWPRGKYVVKITYTTSGRLDALFLFPSDDKVITREFTW